MTVHTLHEGCGGTVTVSTQHSYPSGRWIVYAASCEACGRYKFGKVRAPQQQGGPLLWLRRALNAERR